MEIFLLLVHTSFTETQEKEEPKMKMMEIISHFWVETTINSDDLSKKSQRKPEKSAILTPTFHWLYFFVEIPTIPYEGSS